MYPSFHANNAKRLLIITNSTISLKEAHQRLMFGEAIYLKLQEHKF